MALAETIGKHPRSFSYASAALVIPRLDRFLKEMVMPSSHSRVRACAILALTMLPSCIAQQDTAERMRAARNELFTASKEDVQLFRSPGYLARKINVVRDLMRE